jgi:DNA-binding NarL/FixJ family response regulator
VNPTATLAELEALVDASGVGRVEAAMPTGGRPRQLGRTSRARVERRSAVMCRADARSAHRRRWMVETLLDHVGYVRRSERPARARSLLHDAVELAQLAGLGGWGLDRSRAGGRRRSTPSRAEQPDGLTAQERRVTHLVAARRITETSVVRSTVASTIESCLEHIYAKLKIHSHRELMMAAGTDANVAEALTRSP